MKRRILSAIFVVAVLVGYFLSEALLRRTVYYTPRKSTDGKKQLIDRLPSFLRKYFEEREKIALLEKKIAEEDDHLERIKLRYELSGLVSESRRAKLMKESIAEAPDSPVVARAWAVLLPQMDEEEILSAYLDYTGRCDIRRPRDKVRVWQTGLGAMGKASRESRMQYIRKMAEARVVGADFYYAYDELCSHLAAKGESSSAREITELRDICEKKLQEANKPKQN